MKVLLSIKPEYATKIFTGEKKYEYRKIIFKNKNVQRVVVYASSPMRKVIGEFEIDEIISEHPDVIWEKTYKYSGISKNIFERYSNSKDVIHAIRIGKYKLYRKKISLKDKFNIAFAPQSFVYLS
jgi:predicted transcriptional regulator